MVRKYRSGTCTLSLTRLATEFTIKQKANKQKGNKGDKIFPPENIYDLPYFKAAPARVDRRAKDFCEESGQSLFPLAESTIYWHSRGWST